MSMPELKPCPFCGHTAHVIQLKQSAYYIACGNSVERCIASAHWVFGSFYLNKADAIESWNRRANNDKR